MARAAATARPTGFTLIEAAVAVAAVSILAGAMMPLALKALNKQRAATTRKHLKLAFEAMFGVRDRRVANMRADFGFDPTHSHATLPFLVSRAWGQVPPYGLHPGSSFYWGYNGPYWQGPVLSGVPVDAWGHPISLRYDATAGTWQLHSLGPDRARGEDDLYYPTIPASANSFKASVLLVITRISADIGGTVTLRYGGNTRSHLASTPAVPIAPFASPQSMPFRVPAGGMELRFTPTSGAFKTFTIPMDLLPGQTREVQVSL